ncbi:MAG: cobyrinate a,c-diamide synthase [Burkholderiales bacterium]
MSRLLISAAHKSSGKTTLSIGLISALTARGLTVQPFKKGPDYIDPMWLSAASGRTCRNLDFYLMRREEIHNVFARHAQDADIAIVEGNKGLYDGLELDGSNSNAALAKLLRLPVVLVLDTRGVIRGVAPLLLGYQAFDREVNIAGVILNHVGGSRHEAKLRAVVEHYTDIPVLGMVQHDKALGIDERHLGLMPSNETPEAARHIAEMGRIIGDQVDLDRLLAIARTAPPLTLPPQRHFNAPPPTVRIGIAQDAAFGFYYADDLDALRAAGAELVPFSPMRDPKLPAVDALFLGGGFPEVFAGELSANQSLRTEIRAAIEAGLPAYAECGGLMYLARSISWHGETHAMAGVVPGDVVMHEKPVGRGYVRLKETPCFPWPADDTPPQTVMAHEFHYSSLENLPSDLIYAYDVERGYGVNGTHDGIVHKNLLASYTHLRSLEGYNWAGRFVASVRRIAQQQRTRIAGTH